MEEIICLLSVDNDYNQPDNNLVAWFTEKPSIEELLEHFGCPITASDQVVQIVQLWSGQTVRIGNTDYRLQAWGKGFHKE